MATCAAAASAHVNATNMRIRSGVIAPPHEKTERRARLMSAVRAFIDALVLGRLQTCVIARVPDQLLDRGENLLRGFENGTITNW
jgi:hypothetical protein